MGKTKINSLQLNLNEKESLNFQFQSFKIEIEFEKEIFAKGIVFFFFQSIHKFVFCC